MTVNYTRHIKYIDRHLQGSLIVALMVLESLLVIAAMVYLYFDYSTLLENYIYSIHRVADEDLFIHMIKHLLVVISVMTVFNLVLLLVVNSLWVRHIRRIVSCFTSGLRAIRDLDLRKRPACPVHHEVLDTLEAWRSREARRYSSLGSHLQSVMDGSTGERLQAIDQALQVLPRKH